jgi:hypothetical protein
VVEQERDVITLVSDLRRGTAFCSLVAVVESSDARDFHDPRNQLHDVSRGVVGSDEQPDVEVAPAHQIRDVTARHEQQTEIREDP